MKLHLTTRISGLTRFIFQGEYVDATVVLGPENLAIGADDDSMLAPADPAHPVWLVFVQACGPRVDLALTRDEADQLFEALVGAVTAQTVAHVREHHTINGRFPDTTAAAGAYAGAVADALERQAVGEPTFTGCLDWCALAPDHDGPCGAGLADGVARGDR